MECYATLTRLSREIATLESLGELLSWDQETAMPAKGAEIRSEQRAYVAEKVHDLIVADQFAELLHESESRGASLDEAARANLREWRRRHDRERKVPGKLVREIAQASALAHQPWIDARQQDDFERFAPHLERLVALKKEWAQAVGFELDPYDALLDEYEPGMTSEQLKGMFSTLRNQLVALIHRLDESKKVPPNIGAGPFSPAAQKEFGQRIARDLGFDFNAGRLDESAHPFCTGLAPTDVRLTTRYDSSDPTSSLFGIVHEAGHGMYEQGLQTSRWGTPAGAAVSLGVHESQSRWWENFVARSPSFWKRYYSRYNDCFGNAFRDIPLSEFILFVNKVRRSLIRVESDEVTYNLHILVRMELEQEMFSDSLRVADLPRAWSDRMDAYLGVRPPGNATGVLQDIHWSMGAFGYFPTYTLGNIYAGQLDHALRSTLGDVDALVESGSFPDLLGWMRSNVHAHGAVYEPAELVHQATGEPPTSSYLVNYLTTKYTSLYEV